MIQNSIIKEVIEAHFYSIMVDEVTSHNKEVMPLCVRFVDVHKNIQEEFIQFSTLSRVTGAAIADRVCSDLTNLGLQLKIPGDRDTMEHPTCQVVVLVFRHSLGKKHH